MLSNYNKSLKRSIRSITMYLYIVNLSNKNTGVLFTDKPNMVYLNLNIQI